MAKNYYAILGISSGATEGEIRAAYRRLLREFHPDRYPGGIQIFQQIKEAYAVLGDDQERRKYDRSLANAKTGGSVSHAFYPEAESPIPEAQPTDRDDISLVRSFQTFTPSFDEIFDWLWTNFSAVHYPKSGRVQRLTLEVPITNEQARDGGTARVMVPVRAVCRICRGQGEVGPYECPRCAGEGAIVGEMPVAVSFPSGLKADHGVMIPLDRYGIQNLRLMVLFRLTDAHQ